MCGIAGFYSLQKNVGQSDLRQMTNRIAHRGPDAEGFYFNERQTVGLGHRRLSIIDLSTAANQPMFSADGRYVVVYNGEVYNFKEIASALHLHPKTTSDTEIILEAFAQRGPACVHLFNGMFAFALYDIREDALYLFRDRLGVKPLYYYASSQNFIFCSELQALRRVKAVQSNAPIFTPAVYQFLYSGYIPEPFTFYSSVKKLPAGAYAVVKQGDVQITPYWQPQPKINAAPLTDFNTAKKELNELLVSSVRYRMFSDVPMGTFLSGGIDSSTVTAMAQSLSAQPVHTFSIGFKEAKFNESKYAREVAKHLGTEHHEFVVTEQDALALVYQMIEAYGEPYADSSAIPTMLVAKLARQQVTVALSGDGGDELFMGYGAYRWAKRMSHPLLRLLRRPIYGVLAQMSERYKRAAEIFNYPKPQRLKSHIFSQEQYFFGENELQRLLKDDFRVEPLFQESHSRLARVLSPAEEQALFDLTYYLKDDLLTKVDIATMQFSLEARTPFLDYRVVEFALNVSEQLKMNGGEGKYLLKEVLYDYVPRTLFQRPKWGFSIPLAQWLKTDLHPLIDHYLSKEQIEQAGVVHYGVVAHLLARFHNGEHYLYNRIWSLILLHKWIADHDGG